MKKLLLVLIGLVSLVQAEESLDPGPAPTQKGWIYSRDGDEHSYSQGDNSVRFTLTCNPHKAATMSLMVVSRNQWVKSKSLGFNIDGQPYGNPTNFSDPAVAQRFPWFLKALRNARNVGVNSVTLINTNTSVLPDPDSPDNPCNAGDDQPIAEPSGPVTDNPQFKVSIPRFNPGWRPASNMSIVLTSLNDNVKIEQVLGNRGQCILAQYGQINGLAAPRLPMFMSYGQSVAFPVLSSSKNCYEVYEIEVITSNGTVTYTQQQR